MEQVVHQADTDINFARRIRVMQRCFEFNWPRCICIVECILLEWPATAIWTSSCQPSLNPIIRPSCIIYADWRLRACRRMRVGVFEGRSETVNLKLTIKSYCWCLPAATGRLSLLKMDGVEFPRGEKWEAGKRTVSNPICRETSARFFERLSQELPACGNA